MTPPERNALVQAAERLLDSYELMSVAVTYRTGPDTWQTIIVRESGLFEVTDDGITVIIEDGGL